MNIISSGQALRPGSAKFGEVVHPPQLSEKLKSLTVEELFQVNHAISNSHNLYLFNQLNEIIKTGTRFSELEQKIFDDVIQNYQTFYKSPLANALKENE